MSTPTTLPTDSPDALELVDVEDLWDLAVGDQVVVEFQRYHTPVKTHSDALTGTVVELRSTYEKVNRVLFEDDAGDIYRVAGPGTVDKVRDEGLDAGIGRSADIKVIREIAPDGGRRIDDDAGVLEFPDLEEKFGERLVNTAAHVLDRELSRPGPVQNDLIPSRIRGIDTPEELAAYRTIETRTRNRDSVHELINERAEFLKANGFRPDDLVAANLDPETDLPERFRLRIPLWVSTYDLRESPEIEFETPTRSGGSSSTSSPASESRTTQVTLAADGGVDDA